ncbi:MAG: SDR family oxidoreductase [Dehalococcoidia bacterium]|nr:3 beta-hydroxysteroid dehydrogenase/Delta 5-->4-isomerase [Chloroflexota bacterium]MBT9159269.1 3 beta-hydroxysteroid dehydrogenase/Delta 5-->4-isomerase [Chloroflexota bacterium]MBT9161912.1 3 beta-hydroxysteroid dehydrogenase/Delta 5-->4-isomerase [Chloroflexota bacterium]
MIAVTGATGHIGNVLVRDLLARGEEVRTIIPPFEDTVALEGLRVEKIEGDLRDLDSLTEAFKGADVVYHLAGVISISAGKTELLHQVNVMGTRNVVDACLRSGVRRLVYTSSIHAFVEPPHGTVIDEMTPINPDKIIGEYARSKAEATLEVLNGIKNGLDAVIVFPSGVVGPHDYRLSEMGQFFVDFVKGKLRIYVDGAYDFVDVRDVVQGHILACEKGIAGEGYILSNVRVTVRDLLSMLEEITAIRSPSFKAPAWLARIVARFTPLYCALTKTRPRLTTYSLYTLNANCLISNEKARRQLGYSPRPIAESIQDSIKWFKKAGVA